MLSQTCKLNFTDRFRRTATFATLSYFMPSAYGPMAFLPFWAYLFYVAYIKTFGGELMDEDNDIFELFQEMISHLDQDEPDGMMRILSQNPRYNENTESKEKKTKSQGR